MYGSVNPISWDSGSEKGSSDYYIYTTDAKQIIQYFSLKSGELNLL